MGARSPDAAAEEEEEEEEAANTYTKNPFSNSDSFLLIRVLQTRASLSVRLCALALMLSTAKMVRERKREL